MLHAIEPVLYLPDDLSFHPDAGDDRHALRLLARALGFLPLCLIVYLPVLIWGGFVWQDDMRVTQNMFLWSWNGLAGIWSHAIGGTYHPLAQTFLWGEHHFFQQIHPRGYHIVSVVFHAINAGLLWMVLRRLNVRGAWLAAALFAVHPIEVQSVGWVSQQSRLIGSGFALGAIWAFLRSSRIQPPLPEEFAPSPGHDWEDLMPVEPLKRLYALAIVLAVAAILSDPIGFVVPFVLGILLWWKGTLSRIDWVRLLPFFAIAIAGATLAGVIAARGNTLDVTGTGAALTVMQRLLVDARAIGWYAATSVWPFPLLFVYERWAPVSWWSWQIVFPIGILLVIVGAWAMRRRLGRGPLASVLLFIALLLPGLGGVLGSSAPPIYVADHWAYLAVVVPMAGLAWAAVWLLDAVRFPWVTRGLRVAAAVAAFAGLGFITWEQGTIYDSEESVWKDALNEQPASSVAVNAYARLLLRRGKDLQASEIVREAQEADQHDVPLLQTRAQVYMTQGRYGEAIDCYLHALKIEPRNEQLTDGLAEAYAKDGQAENAKQTYLAALKRHPNDPIILNSLGMLYVGQGKLDEGIAQYQAAIKSNPRLIAARMNLVRAYEIQAGPAKTPAEGMAILQKAAEQLKEVVALDPSNFDAFMNAGGMLCFLRDWSHAEQMFRAAATLKPNNAEPWDRLGLTQATQGKDRMSEAAWNFEHALRVQPDYVPAQEHLAKARADIASIDAQK